jgi:hypothetical protein
MVLSFSHRASAVNRASDTGEPGCRQQKPNECQIHENYRTYFDYFLNPYAEADGKSVKTEKNWSYRDLD